ncbi:ParA family protein [Ligilactobacillus murinus]|uniref:ParA family protein n=1 Tax=Ligilactobacillus murinus TaxID=1622 RepID=UPI00107291B7|nr:ParA family protein [Ligilactobacillus murinus]MBF0758962.1 ParA family protein [Ligilactobacillus murinus]MBF0833397.1 ParA family protein [Ligilactobacillus murinus]TFU63423.1 ParA family protein [Ligilactobacillus murinus]
MEKITIWNNKGGTGKTSIAFQIISEYAIRHKEKKILVLDVCPQANLSELLLGSLSNHGSDHLLQRQGTKVRSTIGGYFQSRLPSPYKQLDNFDPDDYLTVPMKYNDKIPSNITLLCGDPLLELQSNAISTLANNQIPGTNTWLSIIDWLNDFIKPIEKNFDIMFIDTNPSFSIYTQIALATTEKLILPVMADDSSRRAIQNAFSLIYGLKLPSEIYAKYAFAEKLLAAKRELPKVHLILKNRLTQYMGPASAYATVLKAIDSELSELIVKHPNYFTFDTISEGILDIRDFQTAGVVSSARGCPFSKMRAGKLQLGDKRVQVNGDRLNECVTAIQRIVDKI